MAARIYYFDCPACGQRIPEPFRIGSSANTQPQTYTHHRKAHASCRLVVVPGPPPHVRKVPHSMAYEDFLRMLP